MAQRPGQRTRGGLIEVASRRPRVDERESPRPGPGDRAPGTPAVPPATPGRRTAGSSSPGPVLGLPALTTAAVKEVARLATQPRWTNALKGASPDQPELVRRLDRPQEYYALVGFRIGWRLTARVTVDAHDASPGATMGIELASAALTPFRTMADARGAVNGYLNGCRSVDDTDDLIIEPCLVWRPCPESPSAFSPFYLVRRKTTRLFYRVDGRLFVKLTRGSGV